MKAEEHIAELESRSAPSSSVAAAEPRRSVATAKSRPKPRRKGKPRGIRDPKTVALKKARRYARRHNTLDPTTPEALRRRQLAALGHPDPGSPETSTPTECPSGDEGGEVQQSVEVTGASSAVDWPLRAKTEVKLEEEKTEVKLEEEEAPQLRRAVKLVSEREITQRLKRRAPSSESEAPVSPSFDPDRAERSSPARPKFWGKAAARVTPRGSVLGHLIDGGGNSSSRGSNTAAGSTEPKQ